MHHHNQRSQEGDPSAAALHGVNQRLTRLERQLRAYRLGLISLLAVIVIALVGGAAKQKTPAELRARRFAVVDDQGRVKAYIGHSGTSTALQIGADGQGIRMEHGAHTNAIQLITPANMEGEVEGFHSNSLTLHNDPYNSGVLIINPGTRDDGNSRGRVWLSTLKGYEMSREMF
jgi:hypothetical protein